MNPNMAYYALETKIAAKKGHILNKVEWEKYLECSDIDRLVQLLESNTEFGKAFKDIERREIHRDKLEILLLKFKTFEIETLLNYFSGPYKEFVKATLMEGEIQDISLILRKITRGESLEGIEDRFVHSKIHSKLPYDDLLSSKSVEQFIQRLNGTIYYSGLSNLTREDVIKRDFHIEMKMYLALYKNLLERAKKLKKDDRNAVLDIIGLRIDLLNIQWIYRAKKYYEISPEEIFNYSLEGGKVLEYDKLKKLCYASAEEFKQLTKIFGYDFFDDLDADIDVVIDTFMLDYLKNKRYKNIGTVLSFIIVLSIIINDLTSIIEGIEYKVPKDSLKGYLAYKI